MEVITYANISVKGFPFHKILSLNIKHRINEHGEANITGEIKSDEAQELVKRVDERLEVSVITTADGQPSKLFCGCVKSINLKQGNEYSIINIQLYSASRKLDITKKDKTYQNISKTYGQIISENIADMGDLHMMISDKAIGSLIMKYNETDWQFAMRMAGQLNAPLVTDIASARAQLYIGLPPSRKTVVVDTKFFNYGKNVLEEYAESGFAEENVETQQYAYIGDIISLNGGRSKYIKGVEAHMSGGIMQITYELTDGGSTGGNSGGIAAPKVSSSASGKMMKGIVKAVKRDKVQVHLTDVDKSYDGGGNWWFPFSTAYSSSDGSGWYCMPETGDEVRVFFPSGSEGEAFAASSVCANPPTNPKHKSWKAPGGKEILLTDKGMYIIGKSGKIFINLTDEKGIEIYSDKEINISSDAKVCISAADEVHVIAENEVIIGTEEAYMDIAKDTVTLAASEVLIN